MKLRDLGEIGLINRLARRFRLDRSVIRGIGDDTAVIKWAHDKYLLFTCDMLVEDIHFPRKAATPYQIGWKALGRNLSDIAAMGGVARHAVVSIGIDPDLPVGFADGILRGLNDLAKRFGVNIVGGDTVKSQKLIMDVSVIGEVEKDKLTLRSGAKKGDAIFVTGSLGGSIKGKHLNFMPRLNEARRLVKNFRINSMIDISDGLVLDLWRVLEASSAGANIYENLIPVSKDAELFEKALTGGEDFELLFTMSAREAKRLLRGARSKIGVTVTPIGEITGKKNGYILTRENGSRKKLGPRGYLHF